jgi:hypothetical protein
VALGAGEDMRMAGDHLVDQAARDVVEGEGATFLGHAGMEDHLEQQVAEFLAQVAHVAARDRVRDLVGFLDRVGRDGREVLRDVPRASIARVAEPCHHGEEAVYGALFLRHP